MPSTLHKATTGASDYHYFATPRYAVDILIPYLKEKNYKYIWECACGLGHITNSLIDNEFEVYQSDIIDFKNNEREVHKLDFTTVTNVPDENIDAIVTNPPYNIKDKFLKKCYELEIPFALLMPLSALGAKQRISMYRHYGIEILVPDGRVNFIYKEQKERNWFHTAWFCYKILPEKIVFTEMRKDDRDKSQLRFS